MDFTFPPRGVELVLLLVVITAALFDLRYRRIPNWLTAGSAGLGLALNAFLSQARGGMFKSSLIGFGAAFGIYFVLYALRAMGGGDVKLMAAVGAIVGWPNWFLLFLVTSVLGGVMGVILVVVRGRLKTTLFNVGFILNEMKSGRPAYVGKEELDVRSPKALSLPHGAVIAIGTLFFLAIVGHVGG
ncbi:MAG TPA: A24 family peptidase [Bryobacteraceae bacterium]|nr:A24 family peptidase [Bryobacteraceae bacterium]